MTVMAPALLTMTSRRPKVATVSSTARGTSFSRETSPPIPIAIASDARWLTAGAAGGERDLAFVAPHADPTARKRSRRSSAGSSTERSAA
jgi:hypothetical protein